MAADLEGQEARKSFWCFSKTCLILFIGLAIVGVGVGLGVYFGIRSKQG
jgi:uncharacterized membrane protein YhaH (DUF805 family)